MAAARSGASAAVARRGAATARKAGLITSMVVSGLIILFLIGAGTAHTVFTLRGDVELLLPAAPIPDGTWSELSPKITSGTPESFILTLEGVESEGLAQYAALMGVGFAAIALFFAFVYYLCHRLYRGKPFGRLMTVGFAASSAVMIIGTVALPSVWTDINERILVDAGISLADAPFTAGYVLGAGDALTLALGIFLALLAAAFHIGSRLQRDGEGLV